MRFKAKGQITNQDFSETVVPKVKALIDKTDKLNYLLVLETSVMNFTIGPWIKDAMTGIPQITTWNRAAIVCDVKAVRKFTNLFSYRIPGEFKGFHHKDLQQAIDTVVGK